MDADLAQPEGSARDCSAAAARRPKRAKTGGRKPGTLNRKTIARRELAAKIAEVLLCQAPELRAEAARVVSDDVLARPDVMQIIAERLLAGAPRDEERS